MLHGAANWHTCRQQKPAGRHLCNGSRWRKRGGGINGLALRGSNTADTGGYCPRAKASAMGWPPREGRGETTRPTVIYDGMGEEEARGGKEEARGGEEGHAGERRGTWSICEMTLRGIRSMRSPPSASW